jgi:hypothetical protein
MSTCPAHPARPVCPLASAAADAAGTCPAAGRLVCGARGAVDAQRFDARRVARAEQALRLGRFEVNAQAIAERLLAVPGLLAGRRPH